MNVRLMLFLSLALAVAFERNAAGMDNEEKPKIIKTQLQGKWMYGEKLPAFVLYADGSGTAYTPDDTPRNAQADRHEFVCRWEFNEQYQVLIVFIVKLQVRREYKVQLEANRMVLTEGREVFRDGLNMNLQLGWPWSAAFKKK